MIGALLSDIISHLKIGPGMAPAVKFFDCFFVFRASLRPANCHRLKLNIWLAGLAAGADDFNERHVYPRDVHYTSSVKTIRVIFVHSADIDSGTEMFVLV